LPLVLAELPAWIHGSGLRAAIRVVSLLVVDTAATIEEKSGS
jgi:hypothetical protein